MGAIGFFMAAIAASTSLTALAVGVLRRPMSHVLAELCGSRRRGAFWVTLASLCMLLAAASAATFPDVTLHGPVAESRTLLLNAAAVASGAPGLHAETLYYPRELSLSIPAVIT